jgi:hypothetical protein
MYGLDIGYIGHLYTPLRTTSNYNTTDNLHTLQITAANNNYFPARTVSNSLSLPTVSNNEDSSDSSAQVLPVRRISRN